MDKTFYQFILTYRGKTSPDDESRLADWVFHDAGFPKQATTYSEISDYLEMNSPFEGALRVFDDLFDVYLIKNNRYF